jgi:hypothetical protein
MSTHHDVDDEHLKYDLSKEERNAFDMYMAACTFFYRSVSGCYRTT